jgi:cephalosporin-C deacetylase
MDVLSPKAETPLGFSMMSPYVPEDFDEFWAEATAEADAVKLDFSRRTVGFRGMDEFRVDLLDFQGMSGTLHGWIAIPNERPGRLPAFLWLPPYGRESSLPDFYSTRAGMVSFSFNFHGHAAFHQEAYQPSRGYFSQGIADPHTWVFREMAQNAHIAMRVLQAQIEADEDRLSVAGLSQGGGMAIWVGAHSPIVKSVVADLPFLSAMNDTLSKEVYRYPLKEVTDFAATIPLGMERVLNTVSYFDTMNQATRCKAPTLVSLGEKDPSVRPACVRATYEALAGPKRLIEYPTGHDWNPGMIPAGRDWMVSGL